jgi:signal transduction histidine kinase
LWFVHFHVTKPLSAIAGASSKIASGELTQRVTFNANDEIGSLARAFNKMASRLQDVYSNLESKIIEKTSQLSQLLKQFELKNKELQEAQRATVNLLEDLEIEKQAIERRVQERTKDIEHEKRKLLQVTNNMRGAAFLFNDRHEVSFANNRMYELLGLLLDTPYNTLLESFFELFPGTGIKEYFNRGFNESFHVPEINSKEGRIYEIFFDSLTGEKNGAVFAEGMFLLAFDITDFKLLERSKSELVAVASHQLRTPLTALRGNVEMLIDKAFGPLNKEQYELLADMEISTIRLITMVNDMLDITKIEHGNLEMNLEKLNIKEIIDSVINDLRTYAAAHHFTVDNSGVDPTACVMGDRIRVRQIFQNLIDNAIKYSRSSGTLIISNTIKDSMFEIAFADNGIGIPEREHGKLFERFYRATNTANASSSGSGLGLYIVKSIAKQLGGDIKFVSKENEGTTFIVTLPFCSN